ncbi:MAG TPA: hypothetical protein PKK23_08625 [Nitrospirales bacterium]|nr:hypothetical protein [Nitrospirales bacterium]
MDRKSHWEDVYRTTAAEEFGRYHAHPTMSLHRIESTRVVQSENLKTSESRKDKNKDS